MTSLRAAAAAALAVFAAAPVGAFTGNRGGDSAQWLSLGAGARALGMAEAQTAAVVGADAIFWNPGALAGVTRPEVTYSHVEFLRFFRHEFLAYAHPVPALHGTVAVGGTAFHQDDIAARTAGNQQVGNFSPHGEALSIAYAHTFWEELDVPKRDREYFQDRLDDPFVYKPIHTEQFPWQGSMRAGLALKLIHDSIRERKATSFAVDAGVTYHPWETEGLALGFAVRNFGSRHTFIRDPQSLPVEVSFGLAYDWRLETRRFQPTVDLALPYYGDPNLRVGMEYAWLMGAGTEAAFRAGYKTQAVRGLSLLSGACVGIGVKMPRFQFDFGFQPMAELSETYRMSLGWRF